MDQVDSAGREDLLLLLCEEMRIRDRCVLAVHKALCMWGVMNQHSDMWVSSWVHATRRCVKVLMRVPWI